MKKTYVFPQMNIEIFHVTDVITTSNGIQQKTAGDYNLEFDFNQNA